MYAQWIHGYNRYAYDGSNLHFGVVDGDFGGGVFKVTACFGKRGFLHVSNVHRFEINSTTLPLQSDVVDPSVERVWERNVVDFPNTSAVVV